MTEKKVNFVNILYFIMIVLFIGVRIAANFGFFDLFGTSGSDLVFTLIVQIIIMLLLPIVAITINRKQKVKDTLKDFKIKKLSMKSTLCAFGIGVIVFLLNISISSAFSYIIELLGYESASTSTDTSSYIGIGNFLISFLTTAILPGICEEVTHRGMLLQSYKGFGVKKAIIYSSLLFGLMHLNINQFFYATIVGAIIGMVVIASGNTVAGMIIHFCNNALSVYFSFAYYNGWFGGKIYAILVNCLQLIGGALGFVFTFGIVALLIYLFIVLLTKMIVDCRGKEFQDKTKICVLKKMYEFNGEMLFDESKMKTDEFLNTLPNEQLDLKIIKKVVNENGIETFNDKDVVLRKRTLWESIFMWSTIVMASLVTLFTFVWGLL